jgi:FAD/FMN-containing dehydrogenase
MQSFFHRSILQRFKLVLLILLATTTIALTIVARPLLHLAQIAWSDQDERLPLPAGTVDDASRLNQTRMKVVQVPGDLAVAEAQIRYLIRQAKTEGWKVTIAGSRHTMGGHTIYGNGLSLDMAHFNQMQLNQQSGILTVQSGATWSQIIPYLNQYGYSVAVMQSNNDFSVGGTMSANAHGWQHNHSPFASTVESFRLMLADGTIVRCSRQENQELFSLALGGYGLFGVILDVNLHLVSNEQYSFEQVILPAQNYTETFQQRMSADVGMAYGRLSIAPDSFLEEAILTTYHRQKTADHDFPLTEPSQSELVRLIFRGSVGSEYGKQLRWQLEKAIGGEAGTQVSRNQILNRSSQLLENYRQAEADILHEYFIPSAFLEAFLAQCRTIIPQHDVDLLNVTVRDVYPDQDSFLRYADQEMFGLVMLFHQQRDAANEIKMQKLTQALVDAALAVGGRYYLPYRLHATPDQFHQAYPQAKQFFERKRHYDPEQIFQNKFYIKYGI